MAEDINKDDIDLDSDTRVEDELEPVGNPAPPTDVDLNLLRGDRIGDTVYSGKWCIQTVMKMMQSNVVMKPEETEQTDEGKSEVVDMDEDLQNEVGVLWDMTSNVEVCQYLQSVGAIESIYHVIANSRCPRATEMCVGMLANIVTHDELWQSLHSDSTLFAILIPLFTSTDQPVLLELSRFFTTALSHSNIAHCYASMCSQGSLVVQELVRILSGSTNCDLLKQITELTHLLMCLDEDDTHFNVLVADADFMTAVLEASKEIGYDQESSTQSTIMEILHCFTTYQSGINAMEMCMEPITDAIVKYLRCLCHNINLSSSSDVISIIITLLNHIFCRSLRVRIELMSSSKLLQYILKVLVTLYRRLGLYDTLTQNPQDHLNERHNHHHKHHHRHHHRHHNNRNHRKQQKTEDEKTTLLAMSAWESTSVEEEEESKASREETVSKSWSERAGIGQTTPKHLSTPDPSPKHAQGMKEIEYLSWSERRMASPLVEGGEIATDSDVWKIPRDKKARKKKVKSTMDDRSINDEKNELDEKTEEERVNRDEKCTSPLVLNEENRQLENDGLGVEHQEEGYQRQCRNSRTDSTKSSGFSPSLDYNEMDESMDCGGDKADKDGTASVDNKNGEQILSEHDVVTDNGERNDIVSTQKKLQIGDSSPKDIMEENKNDEKGKEQLEAMLNGEDSEEQLRETRTLRDKVGQNRRADHSTLDKYQRLYNVVKEFLSDFFNNLREGLMTDDGMPVISDILSFLNTQCRLSTLRAVVHCVGPNKDITTPVGRLIHLAAILNANNLHRLLQEITTNATD